MFRSAVTLEVEVGGDPSQDAFVASRGSAAAAGTYIQQVTAPAVIEQVIARLGLDMTTRRVLAFISATQVNDTGMFQVAGSTQPGAGQGAC